MSGREAFQNQTVSLYVQFFGAGGAPETGTLVSGTLTIGDGSPITCTISGQTLLATVPFSQELGLTTFLYNWQQIVQGVTSDQSVSFPVTIIAQPSGSSQSYVPPNTTRQCMRLCEPDDRTDEQYNSGNLAIYCNPPYSILRSIFANLPNSGPDLVSFSYVDGTGQAGTLTINCWLWMSDNSYILVSADNGVQMAIASINANFVDTYATPINTRNTNSGTAPLSPCANASRYDYPVLLPNQAIPNVWYYDGVLLASNTSSSPTII